MDVLETIEKPAKKTYQKHKTEKKVGISFYLNQKLKPTLFEGKEYFSVYCRISYNGTDTKVKSESFEIGVSETDWLDKTNIVHKRLEREKNKKEAGLKNIINNSQFEFISANDLYVEYSEIYEKDFSLILYQYLNTCISNCYVDCSMIEICKNNGGDYYNSSDEFIDKMFADFFPIHSFSDGSPEINLDIVSLKYPIVKEFLLSKFPSKIWRLKELIYFTHSISHRIEFSYDSVYKVEESFSWFDIESGRFKRFLELYSKKGILSQEEINKILNDLQKIDYINYHGHLGKTSNDLMKLMDEFDKFME